MESLYLYTHKTDSDPEDGGRIYLRNTGNTRHINKMQRPQFMERYSAVIVTTFYPPMALGQTRVGGVIMLRCEGLMANFLLSFAPATICVPIVADTLVTHCYWFGHEQRCEIGL
jgi:hypothetical protein